MRTGPLTEDTQSEQRLAALEEQVARLQTRLDDFEKYTLRVDRLFQPANGLIAALLGGALLACAAAWGWGKVIQKVV